MSDIKMKPVDVVVVGSGVAGSIMAMELANAGLSVVCLERGRLMSEADFAKPSVYDELKFERHSDIFQNLSRETITFRNHGGERALPMRELGSFKPGEMVGGSAVHWGGNARRFLPHDFEIRSRITERYGAGFIAEHSTIQDWGVTWDDVEPYYDQFEHIYGVGGKAGNLNGEIQAGGNPYEGPRSREYPNPPTQRAPQGAVFANAAEELGYVPYQGAAAAMTQDYQNLYKVHLLQCQRGGFCSSHVCAEGAKANPMSAVLPALFKQKNFELRPLCNVVKVNKDSTGKKATGVTYIDAKGREVEQPASIVVLSSYCFNNVRLLLVSGIGKPYDPVSGRGVVGRNYSYQAGGRVQVFFDDREFNPFIGGGQCNTSIDEFNGDVIDRGPLGFVGGAYVNTSSPGASPIKTKPVPYGTPRWGSEWKKAVARNYRRTLGIHIHASCMSYRHNYLDLDPTYKDAFGLPLLRMTFDWHSNEKKMVKWVTEKCVEIAKVMNPANISSRDKGDKYSIVPYQSTHNVGGAVMGADPCTSVVNKYLQSWDVSNLFVVGGSAFPQNAANGPTETIGMLACWAADGIKELYLRNPGSMV
ncbi:GMC family oxidoreductase [Achromobacter aloeverae]